MAQVTPFWHRVIETHDRVVNHPTEEHVISVGDDKATVWAKRDSESNQLKVVIETENTRW